MYVHMYVCYLKNNHAKFHSDPIGYWHDNIVYQHLSVSRAVHCDTSNSKVSEQVNRKSTAVYTMVRDSRKSRQKMV